MRVVRQHECVSDEKTVECPVTAPELAARDTRKAQKTFSQNSLPLSLPSNPKIYRSHSIVAFIG